MNIDNASNYQKQPQFMQQDTMQGSHKAVVVGVRDPMSQGRVRCHIYSVHGDYAGLDVDSLPWCEIDKTGNREHLPYEMFDRVWVEFEAGDKQHPVVKGSWAANPAGRGKLPYSKRVGSEVRPEGWHNHGLYPEARVISSDGQGNTIWTEGKLLDDKSLISSLNLEDTGGKQIKVRSIHTNATDYTPLQEVPSGQSLADLSLGVCTPTRDGLTPPTKVAGSIELNQQNVSRSMQSSIDIFSVDRVVQKGGVDQYNVNGDIHRTRQGNASLNLFNNCLALNSQTGVFLSNHFQTPRRWD